MHFHQSAIAAIAAALFTDIAVAAPFWDRSNDSHTGGPSSTLSTVTIPIATEAPPASTTSAAAGEAAPPEGLSKTQQILLSDTRADAVNNVLTDDREDFVFDFNAKRAPSPPGEGGEIVTANRKTFPVSHTHTNSHTSHWRVRTEVL